MFNWFRQQVLFVMRVPHDPEPPFGAPGSTRVFRAGRKYFTLRILGWGLTQVFVLAGILFWAVVWHNVEATVREERLTRATLAPLTPNNLGNRHNKPTLSPAEKAQGKKPTNRRSEGWEVFKLALVEIALRLPSWVFPLIWVLKLTGFTLYLAQIPFTYAVRRLDYELRWYIVTDRSLRIRTGLVRLQESTMSFANLQQVEVKQNPLQRLLGLADVHVQSAGGGGQQGRGQGPMNDSLHTGIFHSVDNATEIRDLILDRLRQFRQAGLGDPDDHHHQAGDGSGAPHPSATAAATAEPCASAVANSDALAAVREVLAEARALRMSLR